MMKRGARASIWDLPEHGTRGPRPRHDRAAIAATDLLRDTALPVALIAANVGYTSEAAFSRTFKRHYGTPPARWRRDIRARLS